MLAPSCSRKAEAGHEGAHRLRARAPLAQARARVPRLVASTSRRRPCAEGYLAEYDAEPERYGPPAPPDPERDRKRTGHHDEPDGQTAATVHAPVKVDNELYVRDYSKCILCYKCVDACGEQYQNTFAITVAGRGFDARISTEYVVDAAGVGVRLLRQLHRRLPDRRADVPQRARPARGRRVGARTQTVTTDDLPVLRRRLQPRAARAGQRDRQGHEPGRPRRHARQPLHQGPLRLPARPGAARRREAQAMATTERPPLRGARSSARARRADGAARASAATGWPARSRSRSARRARPDGRPGRGHDAHARATTSSSRPASCTPRA